jgi:hypothetical protein
MLILLEIKQPKFEEIFSTPVKSIDFKKRVKRIQKRKLRIIDSFEGIKKKLDFSAIDIVKPTGQFFQSQTSSSSNPKFLR